MNERIKELAEQAGFLVDRSGCIMVSFTSNGDSEVKKFAELIVRECAKRSGELGNPELSLGLLKHFGVEE